MSSAREYDTVTKDTDPLTTGNTTSEFGMDRDRQGLGQTGLDDNTRSSGYDNTTSSTAGALGGAGYDNTTSNAAPIYDTVTSDIDPSTTGSTNTEFTQGHSGHGLGQTSNSRGYDNSSYDTGNQGSSYTGDQDTGYTGSTGHASNTSNTSNLSSSNNNTAEHDYNTKTSRITDQDTPAGGDGSGIGSDIQASKDGARLTDSRQTPATLINQNEDADRETPHQSGQTQTAIKAGTTTEPSTNVPAANLDNLPSHETMQSLEQEVERERGGPPPKPSMIKQLLP